jgi:hypothetical protein
LHPPPPRGIADNGCTDGMAGAVSGWGPRLPWRHGARRSDLGAGPLRHPRESKPGFAHLPSRETPMAGWRHTRQMYHDRSQSLLAEPQ